MTERGADSAEPMVTIRWTRSYLQRVHQIWEHQVPASVARRMVQVPHPEDDQTFCDLGTRVDERTTPIEHDELEFHGSTAASTRT